MTLLLLLLAVRGFFRSAVCRRISSVPCAKSPFRWQSLQSVISLEIWGENADAAVKEFGFAISVLWAFWTPLSRLRRPARATGRVMRHLRDGCQPKYPCHWHVCEHLRAAACQAHAVTTPDGNLGHWDSPFPAAGSAKQGRDLALEIGARLGEIGSRRQRRELGGDPFRHRPKGAGRGGVERLRQALDRRADVPRHLRPPAPAARSRRARRSSAAPDRATPARRRRGPARRSRCARPPAAGARRRRSRRRGGPPRDAARARAAPSNPGSLRSSTRRRRRAPDRRAAPRARGVGLARDQPRALGPQQRHPRLVRAGILRERGAQARRAPRPPARSRAPRSRPRSGARRDRRAPRRRDPARGKSQSASKRRTR